MNIRNPTAHVLVLLLLLMFLVGCGSAPSYIASPILSAEEQAQAEQRRLELNTQRKKARAEEAEKRGLLSLTDEQKAQFMEDFLSKLRAGNTGCDVVIDIGYFDSQYWGVRCQNGTLFPVNVSGDELLALSRQWVETYQGIDISEAVWFISDNN